MVKQLVLLLWKASFRVQEMLVFRNSHIFSNLQKWLKTGVFADKLTAC